MEAPAERAWVPGRRMAVTSLDQVPVTLFGMTGKGDRRDRRLLPERRSDALREAGLDLAGMKNVELMRNTASRGVASGHGGTGRSPFAHAF